MGYSYDEELDMYMDDDGHMMTEDMLPEDMQENLRMQRHADLEWKMAQEEAESDRRYFEEIRNAYLAGDKEGIIKYANYCINNKYEYDCSGLEKYNELIDAVEKAAELGNVPAIKFITKAYAFGNAEGYMEPDYDKFLYWAEKAKEIDDAIFLSYLGDYYWSAFSEDNKKECKDKAKEVYNKAIELGSVESMLAMYHIEKDEGAQACPDFPFLDEPIRPEHKAAEKEHYAKAFDYLLKAAATGNYKAQNLLGLEYFEGNICNKNEQEAFKCFKAVVDDYTKPNFLRELFGLKKNTDDIDDNEEEKNCGLDIFTDHIYAVYNLAYCYENGIGCEANKEKAFELYSSVKKKSEYAKMKVAHFYENGIGVEKNVEKALKIYKAVAKKKFTYGGYYIESPF